MIAVCNKISVVSLLYCHVSNIKLFQEEVYMIPDLEIQNCFIIPVLKLP